LTLTELVVVLALFSVVIGLLIPTVQKVRAAAARAECANHLKRIGIAFQNYEHIKGHYAPGGSHLPPPLGQFSHGAPPDRRDLWSWAYHLLPFIDEGAIHKNPDPLAVSSHPIRIYYCPGRRPAEMYNGDAKIDYAGNAGTDVNGRNGVVMRTGFGLCGPRDVIDGVGHTIAIAEKQLNLAMLGGSEDDRNYAMAGWNGNMAVYRFGTQPPAFDVNRPTCPSSATPSVRFGSSHHSGFNAAYCDGSVRHIRYSVSPDAFRAACVRDDGHSNDPNGY